MQELGQKKCISYFAICFFSLLHWALLTLFHTTVSRHINSTHFRRTYGRQCNWWTTTHLHFDGTDNSYDAPIDEERLEQQKESMRQFMNSYVQKKSDLRKKAAKRQPSVPAAIAAQAHAGSLGASATMSVSTSTSTTSTTVAPARNAAENEEKVAKASKLHGQKEYAMLRPAAAGETRRPLPDLWTPEDIEVQQLVSGQLNFSYPGARRRKGEG